MSRRRSAFVVLALALVSFGLASTAWGSAPRVVFAEDFSSLS